MYLTESNWFELVKNTISIAFNYRSSNVVRQKSHIKFGFIKSSTCNNCIFFKEAIIKQ